MRKIGTAPGKSVKINTFWDKTVTFKKFPPVSQNLLCDVVIVGAGITGISAAYWLSKANYKVVLLDQGNMASGDTACTTAHLTAYPDWGVSKLMELQDEKTVRLSIESHQQAIETIQSTIENEHLDCHFKREEAYLFLGDSDSDRTLHHEMEAIRKIDFEGVDLIEKTPRQSYIEGPAIRIKNQAKVHIYRYLSGLVGVMNRSNVKIYNESHVIKIEPDGVWTDTGYKITADSIVIATHAPIKGTFVFLKQAPYRTYVLGCPIPKDIFHDGLYWDTEDPYHYVRTEFLDPERDLLIVGGEDHKTGQAPEQDYEQPFDRLENWTKKHYPFVKDISYRWSGQILEPVDGLAYIGKIPYRPYPIYMATGYSGNGITYGTIAARMLVDLIQGRSNPFKEIYNPVRKPVKSAGDFLSENLNAVTRFTVDRMKPSDGLQTVEDLSPGEGGIVSHGVHKLAAYRDEQGKLAVCSAVCPHLGCIVHWNSAEKTFDCPCHGSRFSPQGTVLNGPAIKNLVLQT